MNIVQNLLFQHMLFKLLYINFSRKHCLCRPIKELHRFNRIKLKAGETKIISFELPVRKLAFLTRSIKHEFEIWISKDSNSGIPVSFTVE